MRKHRAILVSVLCFYTERLTNPSPTKILRYLALISLGLFKIHLLYIRSGCDLEVMFPQKQILKKKTFNTNARRVNF